MKPWNVVHALKQVSGSNAKIAILKGLEPDSEFWEGAQICYDPYVTFGIKKLPEKAGAGPGVTWAEFKQLTDRLRVKEGTLNERELSGNAARDAVQAFIDKCSEPQWEWWYRRLFDRDLDCGVQVETINKVAPPGKQVRTYEVSLAHPIRKTNIKHVPTEAFYETKYDGYRGTVRVSPDGSVVTKSRNGLDYYTFGPIESQFSNIVEIPGFPEGGLMFDAEFVSDSFNDVQSGARKHENDFRGMAMVFDVLPLDVFDNQGTSAPFVERRMVLIDLITWLQAAVREIGQEPLFELSHCEGIFNPREETFVTEEGLLDFTDDGTLMTFFRQQVDARFEGAMVKNARSPYMFKRHPSVLKLKPTDTYDMRVVDRYEGTGKYKGMLGGVTVELEHPKTGELVRTNMGSGFSDKERQELWQMEIVGKVFEIACDAITTNKRGEPSLRFPVFKRVRHDKS